MALRALQLGGTPSATPGLPTVIGQTLQIHPKWSRKKRIKFFELDLMAENNIC